MDIALKREILEVSFEDIYKKQQKKHKSLDPMKLNQKLISLLSNISYERLGEKGIFFFDDEKESAKTLAEKTLTKLKRHSELNEKKMEEVRRSFELFRQRSNSKNKKNNSKFINSKKKININTLVSDLRMSRNGKKSKTISTYSFNCKQSNKENNKRKFSLFHNKSIQFSSFRVKSEN